MYLVLGSSQVVKRKKTSRQRDTKQAKVSGNVPTNLKITAIICYYVRHSAIDAIALEGNNWQVVLNVQVFSIQISFANDFHQF